MKHIEVVAGIIEYNDKIYKYYNYITFYKIIFYG